MIIPCDAAGELNLEPLLPPGKTKIKFDPTLSTCPMISACAEFPIDISTITEAIPITIPSMVRIERDLA